MIVNIGHRDFGYTCIDTLNEVVSIPKDISIDKKIELVRYLKILSGALIIAYSALSLAYPDLALASTIVNTQPLDRLFSEIYHVLVKVMAYLSTPIWAWVGYTFAFAGNNVEKRTVAKKIAIGLFAGTGITLSAPWLTDQLFALWNMIYA